MRVAERVRLPGRKGATERDMREIVNESRRAVAGFCPNGPLRSLAATALP